MDDRFLVGVLDRLAHRYEQLQPFAHGQAVLLAVGGDRDPLDQLHHEVGPAAGGGAAVEDLGDVGVVHEGQGLPLGLEPGDHLAGVHARLDDLQGNLALHRLALLGHPNFAHASFTDSLQQLVVADDRTRMLGWCISRHVSGRTGNRSVGRLKEAAELALLSE